MKNRFFTAALATLFLLCIHAVVEAKPASVSGGSVFTVLGTKDISGSNESPYPYITSSLKPTPQFLINGVSYEQSKQEKKMAKGWIEVIIPFKTPLSKENPWLENIRVTVEILVPVVNDRQQTEWGVLRGSMTLAPVANGLMEATKGYHNLRVYVSPYIVSRYMAMRTDRKKFEKLIEGFPVMVTFNYENKDYFGGRAASKDFVKLCTGKDAPAFPGSLKLTADSEKETGMLFSYYRKNPRAFFVLEDAVIPASKTPWAWFEYDKQETTIDEQRSR